VYVSEDLNANPPTSSIVKLSYNPRYQLKRVRDKSFAVQLSVNTDINQFQAIQYPSLLLRTLYDLSTLTPMASRSSSVLSRVPRAGISTMVSILVAQIGAKLPFLSLKEFRPVDVECVPKDLHADSEPLAEKWFGEDRELMRLEKLKDELCAVVIIEAQSEESGRRSATIVIARVPASGKESIVVYSRTAKIAFRIS
jgi:hypothetical protein